jgi:hypothetical protein
LQCHSDEEKTGERSRKKRTSGRRDTETESERARGVILMLARTTKRWKAFWFSEKRSPSREAPERESWPPRRADPLLLSKGAEMEGAAEETPILSQHRDGDEECSAGNLRRGALAMRGPFTRLRRPREAPVAGLAGSRKHTFSAESLWLAADGLPLRSQATANARERQAPRGARRSDAGEDIGARGCARTSNLVCRSR